jgi:murein L,D-transpeptidase YafK
VYKLAAFAILAFTSGCAETSSMHTIRDDSRLTPPIDPHPLDMMSTDLPEMFAPRIVITKHQRILEVFDGEKLIKTFRISLGFTPVGDKEREGDGKTPEGDFYIFTRNPKSQFYVSLGISYPGIEDAERGLRTGLISSKEHDAIVEAVREKKMPPQNTALGGLIYLHGGGTGKDWTYGCAALADEDIRELFNAVPVGTPVSIVP